MAIVASTAGQRAFMDAQECLLDAQECQVLRPRNPGAGTGRIMRAVRLMALAACSARIDLSCSECVRSTHCVQQHKARRHMRYRMRRSALHRCARASYMTAVSNFHK
mmetsp:Transcript_44843/g.72166  ORF Transcript_44843/g.72166 Transcript_44843/m.72166 type:complete len:107 (-) Transcript_44843:827-1147(-)